MTYAIVDDVIHRWVEAHELTLHERFGDQTIRCVYLFSADGECCQIWISPPVGDEIRLHAGDVETRNDEEMHMDWQVPVNQLSESLDEAFVSVQQWFDRQTP